jgi:hypothetical protein
MGPPPPPMEPPPPPMEPPPPPMEPPPPPVDPVPPGPGDPAAPQGRGGFNQWHSGRHSSHMMMRDYADTSEEMPPIKKKKDPKKKNTTKKHGAKGKGKA